jgi:hypothetical protein
MAMGPQGPKPSVAVLAKASSKLPDQVMAVAESDSRDRKIWPRVPTGPETKNECARESQQEVTALLC